MNRFIELSHSIINNVPKETFFIIKESLKSEGIDCQDYSDIELVMCWAKELLLNNKKEMFEKFSNISFNKVFIREEVINNGSIVSDDDFIHDEELDTESKILNFYLNPKNLNLTEKTKVLTEKSKNSSSNIVKYSFTYETEDDVNVVNVYLKPLL